MFAHLLHEIPVKYVNTEPIVFESVRRDWQRLPGYALQPCGGWHTKDALCVDCEDAIQRREADMLNHD